MSGRTSAWRVPFGSGFGGPSVAERGDVRRRGWSAVVGRSLSAAAVVLVDVGRGRSLGARRRRFWTAERL